MAKVYKGKSKIQGTGLFANLAFKPGDLIGKFKGARTNKDGKHVLWVYDGSGFIPFKIKNIMKFANHSSQPNAEVIGLEMFSLREISKHEEITFHYGEDFESDSNSDLFSN